MADDPAREGLERELRRLALARAGRNERVLSWVRLLVFGGAAAVDLTSWLWPGLLVDQVVPWTLPASSTTMLGVALAAGIGIHRIGYRPWMAAAMPALDTLGLVFGTGNARAALGVEEFSNLGGDVVAAVAGVLLALTGTLRGSEVAVALSTGLAILAFAVLGAGSVPAPSLAILIGLLGGAGLLALELVRGQRRAFAAEAAQATLARFLPEGVAQRAWDAPLDLLGPPRQEDVAILVTDLRGFTAWSESRSPDEVLAMLDAVQGRLAAVVRARGGTVDKFLGDGMLAVFTGAGAADGALAAAIDVLALPAEPIAAGVGLHAGPAVLGALGSGDRLEFTVLGDTVNTASRLEGLTKQLGVRGLVSAEVLARCARRPDGLVDLGTIEVRGRRQPLHLWGWRG